jgi:predicted outer membrane repeat protein
MDRRVFLSLLLVLTLLISEVPGVAAQTLPGDPETIQTMTTANAAQIMVVSNPDELSHAIATIQDGGIIEMRGGTYFSPSQGSNGLTGFAIQDLGRGFTVRARAGEKVIFDGAGRHALVVGINSSVSRQKPVTFEGITFTNGYSNGNSIAAGVTLHNAEMTFVNCTFTNNRTASADSAGGAVQVAINSTALFVNSTFADNSAKASGGAIEVQDHSRVYIHNSIFRNNRVNLPNHTSYSSGGAIHIGNAIARISNSRFEGNQAGYVGGAIFAIGTFGNSLRTDVIISNSTFINNQAVNDPGVTLQAPSEGGALHIESFSTLRVYSSRFINNNANSGGAVTNYRAQLEVNGSVFLGNRAVGTAQWAGVGGAIAASSNDVPSDGNTNYPSSASTIRNSYFQGRYGTTGTTALVAGAIYATGDMARTYGLGITQQGTAASNRAALVVEQCSFVDFDVIGTSDKAGGGGAIYADLASVNIKNSLVTRSDADGSYSYGGALAFINQSDVNIDKITLANNSADVFGGAAFISGSNALINNGYFFKNAVNNNTYYGSVFFSKPDPATSLNITGTIQNSVFSDNNIVHIFEEDRNGPINDLKYASNQFFGRSIVYNYTNSAQKDVAGLNSFVATRSNGTSTDKGSGNSAPAAKPEIGALIAAPSYILPSGAAGDSGPQPAYLSYAWSGSSAYLNGTKLAVDTKEDAITSAGSYTLKVGTQQTYPASINMAATPTVSVSLDKTVYPYTLSWNLEAGTFLDAFADQHALIPSTKSGSVQVSPSSQETSYRVYMITTEGGVVAQTSQKPTLALPDDVTILAGQNLDSNGGVIPLQNSGVGSFTWTAQVDPKISNTLTLLETSGEVQTVMAVPFQVNASKLSEGTYNYPVTINAGEAGAHTVNIQVIVVEKVFRLQIPLVVR